MSCFSGPCVWHMAFTVFSSHIAVPILRWNRSIEGWSESSALIHTQETMLSKLFQWRKVSIFNGECSGHISKWLLFLSSCHRHHGIFLGECKRDISLRKLRMMYNRVEAKCTFVLKFKGNIETLVYSLKFKRSIEKLCYVNN